MENNNPNYVYDNVIQINDADASRKFIANVFMWMFVALGVSAFCAFMFNQDQALMRFNSRPCNQWPNRIRFVSHVFAACICLDYAFWLKPHFLRGISPYICCLCSSNRH